MFYDIYSALTPHDRPPADDHDGAILSCEELEAGGIREHKVEKQ